MNQKEPYQTHTEGRKGKVSVQTTHMTPRNQGKGTNISGFSHGNGEWPGFMQEGMAAISQQAHSAAQGNLTSSQPNQRHGSPNK